MPDPMKEGFTITLSLRQVLCLLSCLVDAHESTGDDGPLTETARGLIVQLGKFIFVNWPVFVKQAVEDPDESDPTAQENTE